MDFGADVSKAHPGEGNFGDDVVAIFHPDGFEDPFVIGFLKGAISHPWAAEQRHLVIETGKVILQIDGAKERQSGSIGVPSDLNALDLGGDELVDAQPYLRRFVAVDETAVHPDRRRLVVIGDGLSAEVEIMCPVNRRIAASKDDEEAGTLTANITLDSRPMVINHRHPAM